MASRPASADQAVVDVDRPDRPDNASRVDKRPLPEPSESGPAPKLHRPRASRACESCHSRKVRCDVVLSNPCTNCRLDRVVCVEREKKKPPQKPSSPVENGHREINSQLQPALNTNKSPGTAESSLPNPLSPAPSDSSRPPVKYKLPAFIQPLPSRLTSNESDMDYLYSRGAFALPPAHLQNILVQAYIESIYPYMPSIDLHDFLHIIDNRDGSAGRISLLLYQAVMFAATAFIDSRDLIEAGYSSRKEMRKYYFGRVRMLYDFDCEPNRFVVVQGLILMTYWHDTPDGQKDMWYWQGLAINTAYTIDLQRNPEAMGIDPVRAKLWKRVWWSCFMRDRFIGLCLRKPAKIWEEDSDMPMLEESDFDILPLSEGNSSVPASCTLIRDTDTQRVLARQCISTSKLCVVVGRILRAQYTADLRNPTMIENTEESTMYVRPNQADGLGEEVLDTFQAELDAWQAALPPDCQHHPLTADDTIPPRNIVAIHRSVVTLGLHAATLALHRPSMISKERDPARRQASLDRIRNAAEQTALIAGEVYKLQLDMFMPAVTAILLLPSAAVHLEQLSSLDFAQRALAARAFVNCMLVMQTLRQAFYGADFIMMQLGGALDRMHVDTKQYAADPEVVDMLDRMTSAAPEVGDSVQRMEPFLITNLYRTSADIGMASENVATGVDPNMAQRFADDVVHVDLTTLLLQLVDKAQTSQNPPWNEQTYI